MSGVDLRLAIAAAVAWVCLTVCLSRPPQVALGVAFSGVVIAAAALALRVPCARAVALAAGCAVLVLVPFAARLAHARASPLARLAADHAAVTLELTLDGDPKQLASTGPSGASRMVADSSAVAVLYAGSRSSVAGEVVVLGPATGWIGALPGQTVIADGRLLPTLDAGSMAVTFSTNRAPSLLGRPPWWQRVAGDIRSALRSAATVLPSEERGLLPGLIDGDTAALDPVLAQRFRVAGLTHLVAVSGTNCSILVGAVLLVLRRTRARRWVCAAAGAVVLVAFVIVARGSPSVLRAAVMAAIALTALAAGRPKQVLPAIAAAVVLLLLYSPGLAVDAGFAMSVLASGALVLLAPPWGTWLVAHRVPAIVAEPLAVAAAAHVVTAPVIAAISGRVSLVAIPANVLAEPAVAVVTVLGFLAAAVAPVWLPGGQVLAWTAGWPCRWLVLVAEHAGRLEGASLPWPSGLGGGLSLLVVLALLVGLARYAGPARWIAGIAVLTGLLLVPARSVTLGWPPAGWVLVACDIGQGDGLVLPAGQGSAVVVDTGPDPVPMDRCLHDLGVTRIALLVLTHFHLDHVGGIVGALHGRAVDRALVSPLAEPPEGVRMVQRALGERGVAMVVPSPGASYTIGPTRLDVLSPASAFHNTRSDPNNSSLVMRATVHGIRILLGADAEIDAQQAMLAAGVDLRADVLKVSHHGSAYFDPAFYAAVHAKVAVISVGLNNDYGHPAPSLLTELAKLGVPVRRTDHDGDVAVLVHGGALQTATRHPP